MSIAKTALVTAASGGLGAAIARMLAVELRMKVIINFGQNAVRAEQLEKSADASSKSGIQFLVERAAAEFGGRIDIVISNVGWTCLRDFSSLEDNVNEEDWDRCFTANVKSHLWLFHASKKYLEESNQREAGSAVPINSVAPGSGTNGSSINVPAVVEGVIKSVRQRGDAAVRHYSEQFDKWSPATFKLSKTEIDKVMEQVPGQVLEDIKTVQANVRRFAKAQKESLKEFEMEMAPGVFLGQKNNPIDSVGAYIPGGRYPLLASAHMTILTAKVAGVRNVVACTPPASGKIPLATVAAMHLAGADHIYILGGVQAVAAMAVGTESVPKVDFIAGPGNAFVAEAKRQLFGEIGIDLFAGPTEVLIVADETADPYMVATDLLSQAEHGPDTPAVLISASEDVAKSAIKYCEEQLATLKTAAIASESWKNFGEVILVDALDEAYKVADEFASEHVQILTANPRDALSKMQHYGALFLGPMTCVSYGDKCIGTNHVLPTKQAARYTGGLWVGKFLRTVTYQEVTSPQESGEIKLQEPSNSHFVENFLSKISIQNMASADPTRKDLRHLQRFITTHAADGETTFSDAISEDVQFQTLPDNVDFALCYASNHFPVSFSDDKDVETYKHYTQNLPGITIPTGTVLRVVDMPPGALSPMHRTISLDYGVVLEGEIDLILDSGEKRTMRRGDISVQRGTNHAWKNRSDKSWARMLYVLQPAERLVIAGEALSDNSAATIPGYDKE
ncbi:histidinol dehydrogenase [Paramyrothecium foliicola]|nr:histidinol dehydrogenase [Paramyrothecium foliicola]